MKIKSNIKTDGLSSNHNQAVLRSFVAKVNRKTGALCLCLAISFVLALALTKPAQAQLDPGVHDIYQNGIKVGEIFVPNRAPEAVAYVEHWVLFPSYVYPGGPSADATLVTTIKRGRQHYASEEDFFARVAWSRGYRYVRVDCKESDQLPGR